jgi:DNA-directed RNA polymerase specialized sigma24 family protein
MTNEEFETIYLPKYDLTIRAIARKLAQTNDTLSEDLYQEGLIALWSCTPNRARDNPDAYIRQAIKFRMIDYLRKERIYITESLEARLERGDQIVSDGSQLGHGIRLKERNNGNSRTTADGYSDQERRFRQEEED